MVDLHFARELWPIAAILLLLYFRIPARLRDLIAQRTARPWPRILLFAASFLLLLKLFNLPLLIAGHHVMSAYGLSIQRWSGWFADLSKSAAIDIAGNLLLIAILYFFLRRSPRRWWLWLWTITVPLMIAGVLLTPIYLDPLFNKFEPLQQTDPALVTQLERVVQRGGISIPPSRIFLMRASAKVTQTNAYVTGFGASKRVVVWDTTLQHTPPDQILFVFAHEMGHYVLRHIILGMCFAAALLLVAFRLGALASSWLLARFGLRWRITNLRDPAALAVLLMVLAAAQFLAEPLVSAFSRHIEHAADVYGQEAVHGLVPDPAATAAFSFQSLGEQNLITPEHRPFVEFWTFNHPSIANRIHFAATYDPWQPGAHPRYFQK
jgi:Zn-dependent protease with chaperone function